MEKKTKTVWFDIANVPHVNFLEPVINHMHDYDHIFTVKDFAETKGLFEKKINRDYQLIGHHMGKNKLRKIMGSFTRTFELQRKVPYFDIKISVGGDSSNYVAKMRRKVSITFDDNEKAPNWRYSRFSDLAFWPEVVDVEVLLKQGFKRSKLFQYNGFKEDLYLAEYKPDENFLKTLPFDKFVVVRPENIQANYVNGNNPSIVPKLLKLLSKSGVNILFLPRYKNDSELAVKMENIFIPEGAVNGLDACFHADAVFTGAGTMAREAACLGVPAFSFYAGKELLTVDQKMIDMEWLYFSRDPEELTKKYRDSKRRIADGDRSAKVKQQILSGLDKFLAKTTP